MSRRTAALLVLVRGDSELRIVRRYRACLEAAVEPNSGLTAASRAKQDSAAIILAREANSARVLQPGMIAVTGLPGAGGSARLPPWMDGLLPRLAAASSS
jgi:hypothetical protein